MILLLIKFLVEFFWGNKAKCSSQPTNLKFSQPLLLAKEDTSKLCEHLATLKYESVTSLFIQWAINIHHKADFTLSFELQHLENALRYSEIGS